jgi:hypothetical protein
MTRLINRDKAIAKSKEFLASKIVVEEYQKKRKQIEEGEESKNKTTERKIYVDEDCPICYEKMTANDSISWCHYVCGNNMHTECFDVWTRTGGQTCPWCRSSMLPPSKKQKVNESNLEQTYINVSSVGVEGDPEQQQ